MVNTDPAQKFFKNLQLSYRGAERQAPSILSLGLMLSKVISDAATSGKHQGSWTTEQRLRVVVQDFNSQDGVLAKWQITDDKEKAILNLLQGTTPEARQLLVHHLNFHKWKDSAFTSDLLKSSRWLLSAAPKQAKEPFKKLLTVDSQIQFEFLRNHIHTYVNATRKLKASAKGKARPSVEQWDAAVNYTCIMVAVQREVKTFFNDSNSDLYLKAKQQLDKAFMARDYMAEIAACIDSSLMNWNVQHLSLWTELISPELAGNEQGIQNAVDVQDAEEATTIALYNEVKTKLSSLA